jgi:hypothetical protein
MLELLAAMDTAVAAHGARAHYAWLAGALYDRHAAATRIQTAWRAHSARRWYTRYRATAEFAARQAEYEAQEKVRSCLCVRIMSVCRVGRKCCTLLELPSGNAGDSAA